MKSKMIVNSKTLEKALLAGIPEHTSDEDMIYFRSYDTGVEVAGQYVTNLQRDWQDFYIDVDKAKKLHRVLLSMSEQPITVSYDGNWFTIQEVLV